MSALLSQLPITKYGSFNLSNLLTKISPVKANFDKYKVYYPYTIRDEERADTIAYDYYGNSDYAWLVYIVNGIYDPYFQWPLTYNQFHQYLQAKYGEIYSLKSVISHYVYAGVGGNTDEDIPRSYTMTVDTFNHSTTEQKAGWQPVYLYDHELQLNEDKRQIRLLSNQYLKQVDREVSALLL